MLNEIIESGHWLPYSFALLIGLSMLLYAILDGYDLGVGILSRWVNPQERNTMISAIGPFWDANETWLVLGVGLLLVAFPPAHGIVLSELYLPVGIMILGIIFRGVSFDFRKKSPPHFRPYWDQAFFASSLIVTLMQGYMVGRFVTGFLPGGFALIFSLCFALIVVFGYVLMGATWLIFKCEGELQQKAFRWAKYAILLMSIAGLSSSILAPFVDTRIYDKMFSFPELVVLIVMPLMGGQLTVMMLLILSVMPFREDRLSWLPFAIASLIFMLGFVGLVYSFYPYIIPGHLTLLEASAAKESLLIILVGTLFVFPFLVLYTLFSYWVFRGKSKDLDYGE